MFRMKIYFLFSATTLARPGPDPFASYKNGTLKQYVDFFQLIIKSLLTSCST